MAPYDDVQVFGANINIVFESFGSFRMLASTFLTDEGIGTLDGEGNATVDVNAWYPLPRWLAVFERIQKEMGDEPVNRAGLAVPRNAPFPPHITGLQDALGSLDIAYHMNHKLRGEVMFDPNTGKLLDGIGNYTFRPDAGAKSGTMVCTTPYPCTFDQGIITTVAQRFAPGATVEHASGPCRAKGDARCSYAVTW